MMSYNGLLDTDWFDPVINCNIILCEELIIRIWTKTLDFFKKVVQFFRQAGAPVGCAQHCHCASLSWPCWAG